MKEHRQIMGSSQNLTLQISHFVTKARTTVKKLDNTHPEDELSIIRIRSKKHEIIIAPECSNGHEYILVVVQNPVID
jgi:hypothetical protein